MRAFLVYLYAVQSLVYAASTITSTGDDLFQFDFSLEKLPKASGSHRIFSRDNPSSVITDAVDGFYSILVNA